MITVQGLNYRLKELEIDGQKLKFLRCFRKIGASVGITFPFKIAEQLDMEVDKEVKVEMDYETKTIKILLNTETKTTPDIFLRYENGEFQLWNHLIMQQNLNKILEYNNKIQLKTEVRELNGKKYFIIWL